MKNLVLFFLIGWSIAASAQSMNFSKVYPYSWSQGLPHYAPNGNLEDVFETPSTIPLFDGYLAFGVGVTRDPTVTYTYTGSYVIKLNRTGEVVSGCEF
jgi:hypothetical protein